MCTHIALCLRSSTGCDDQHDSGTDAKSLPIHIFSTNYDHLGHVARAKSSELILKRADEARMQVKKAFNDDQVEPLILLGGDLNSPRNERGWQVSRGDEDIDVFCTVSRLNMSLQLALT